MVDWRHRQTNSLPASMSSAKSYVIESFMAVGSFLCFWPEPGYPPNCFSCVKRLPGALASYSSEHANEKKKPKVATLHILLCHYRIHPQNIQRHLDELVKRRKIYDAREYENRFTKIVGRIFLSGKNLRRREFRLRRQHYCWSFSFLKHLSFSLIVFKISTANFSLNKRRKKP